MKIHDVAQGSPEWHAARCGVITASAIGALITPAGKIADNATSRAYLADVLAQRIVGFVAPTFIGDDMARGIEDEPRARAAYAATYADVEQVGFVTAPIAPGVVLGCSPDGLVGADGGIEIKSRRPKIQIQTVLDGAVPAEHLPQIHASMLVTGRAWWDYVSYCSGLPLVVMRVARDEEWCQRLTLAATEAERRIVEMRTTYETAIALHGWPKTERTAQEIEIT